MQDVSKNPSAKSGFKIHFPIISFLYGDFQDTCSKFFLLDDSTRW